MHPRSSGGGGAVLWANQPSRYCRAACGRRCRTAGYCTRTTALPLSGSCRAKPVSWKACTGSCTPATSSVAGTLGAPLRPKQYSRARSTAYTPAQLASSRPGDSGRLTLRLRLCTPGSTTAPHKSRLSSAYHAHKRAKTPPPGQAVGGGHHRAACENFITNCHGSRQLRGQQYQCRHCRQRRPVHSRTPVHTVAHSRPAAVRNSTARTKLVSRSSSR